MSKPDTSQLDKWNEGLKQADLIADKLGMPIDEGIKELLIGLWVQQIPTNSSCAGHEDRGVFPYIHIGLTPPLDDIKKIDKPMAIHEIFKQFPYLDKARKKNLKIHLKLLDLLSEYYKDHYVNEDERIILTAHGVYGVHRVVNQGVLVQHVFTNAQKKEKLKKYQAEMQNFGKFLKVKYFAEY